MAAFATALTTAIPVIDKIVSAIFPKDKDKKSKDDAISVVAPIKSASGDALQSVSEELSLIAKLLASCLRAEDGIVIMKAVLETNKIGDLSAADKLTIRKSWSVVKKNLKEISDKDTKKLVGAISDVFTKSTFLEVINADTDSIDGDIKEKEWALEPLGRDVDELHKSLDKVNTVAVQVVDSLADGLEKLSTAQSKKPAPKASAKSE
jgi:uncharacterized protein YoxC